MEAWFPELGLEATGLFAATTDFTWADVKVAEAMIRIAVAMIRFFMAVQGTFGNLRSLAAA